jgi:DNA-binding XRE family transcriptional regulator/predicted RNase H-like HicB family nuclease
MRLAGRVWREGRHWLAEVPLLDALAQGRTRAEALGMLADLVETMADKAGFSAEAFPGEGEELELGTSDAATLVAVLLRRQREKHGLSLSEVARRLGARSKTAYARYEQGRSVPSVEKLFELLAAVSPRRDFVLRERPRPPA